VLFLLTGIALTACFTTFALLAAIYTKDKAKGIGVTIIMWFYFTLIFDGIVLFLLFQFSDYPIENYMIALSCLNPIDLVRILILLKIDIAAIMGYTGAIFKEFFGNTGGTILSTIILLLWIIIPANLALRKFNRKDL
jgi:Cu-processing system permease protein